MALFHAYFDDSGKDGRFPIQVIAGYVALPKNARALEIRWRQALQKYDLPYFHMVDCAQGTKTFKGRSREQSSEAIKHFIGIIRQHVSLGFAFATPLHRYKFESTIGKPYKFCAEMILAYMFQELDRHFGSQYRILFHYEAGHQDGAEALRSFSLDKGSQTRKGSASFSFVSKSDSGMIQAADILAWQYSKHIKNLVESRRPPRKDFLALMDDRTKLLAGMPYKDNVLIQFMDGSVITSPRYTQSLKDLFGSEEPKSAEMISYFREVDS
ncbi:DUF3800 domain-containing protein [Aestuariivirga sp.]|uniref:DUF3800 domain-containing protein n=1 Tax=Aestuariivirga sp. TaxID=2650926 RepID=UPI003593D056